MSAVDGASTLGCPRVEQSGLGPAACDAAGGWRDKRAQGALGSVGCFCGSFCCVSQCAAKIRKVRQPLIALTLHSVLHVAEMPHVR